MMPTIAHPGAQSQIRHGATDFDPLAVVELVLVRLAAEGIPVTLSSVERATEAAGRLLWALGVEAVDA